MDSADLLPGLVKLMEDRLGRAGRPVTTAFILLVVLGVSALMIDLIYTKVAKPVVSVFYVESVSVNLVEILMAYGIGAFMWIVVVLTVNRLVLVRAKRIIEEGWLELRKHQTEHLGDNRLHILLTGEDADKQWPEVKRRLDLVNQPLIEKVSALREELMRRQEVREQQEL